MATLETNTEKWRCLFFFLFVGVSTATADRRAFLNDSEDYGIFLKGRVIEWMRRLFYAGNCVDATGDLTLRRMSTGNRVARSTSSSRTWTTVVEVYRFGFACNRTMVVLLLLLALLLPPFVERPPVSVCVCSSPGQVGVDVISGSRLNQAARALWAASKTGLAGRRVPVFSRPNATFRPPPPRPQIVRPSATSFSSTRHRWPN